MVRYKSLVLQVELIKSCPNYHGGGQRFFLDPCQYTFAQILVSLLSQVSAHCEMG